MSRNIIHRIIFNNFLTSHRTVLTSERYYGRWLHRKPAKIVLPYEGSSLKTEQIIDLDLNAAEEFKEAEESKDAKGQKSTSPGSKSKNKQKKSVAQLVEKVDSKKGLLNSQKKSVTQLVEKVDSKKVLINSKEIKENRIKSIAKQQISLDALDVFDENNEVIYEKLNDNDGRIGPLLLKLRSKKDRGRTGKILVEGWRLIVDGIQAKCKLRYVIFSNIENLNRLKPHLPKTGVKVFKTSYKEISMWSDVETSPGLFGIFETPSPDKLKYNNTPLPINIICDNIRVPGNLGAILRTAVAVGCQGVYLMKGCVDHWDPKVLRSAAGAHFRLPVFSSLQWEDIPALVGDETSVFIADNNTDTSDNAGKKDYLKEIEDLASSIPVIPYYGIEFATLSSITLIIGGETEGISAGCFVFAENRKSLRLNIPMQKGVDSLNSGMAAAVIAFEIKKQLLQAKAREQSEIEKEDASSI